MKVNVEGLQKRYGDIEALNGISFELESGGLYCTLGPSGSGKTTLLRILGMLEKPDLGRVLYDGRTGDRSIRMRTVMVLQKPVVFKRTVYENVAYGLRIRMASKEEVDERVCSALSLVRLDGYEDRWAPALSGGEQQRVAFARAIVVEPSLLLLDEFTANLDPAHVKVLEGAVSEYRKNRGSTVLMASHDLFLVRRMKPRVLFVKDGELLESSDPEEFLAGAKTEDGRKFVNGEL